MALNPEVTVKKYHEMACAANIGQIVDGYEFVIDGTDNFVAKFLTDDAYVPKGKPYSHGGGLRFDGQSMTVIPGKSARYRCISQVPLPNPKRLFHAIRKPVFYFLQSLVLQKANSYLSIEAVYANKG
jgi:molybdopterin/thiamine biosynthesis adenylyltransferase